MKNLILTPPTLGFVVGTRAALAFGAGLLLAQRIPDSRRRVLGTTLIGLGAATTIPAARLLFRKPTTAWDRARTQAHAWVGRTFTSSVLSSWARRWQR